MLLAADDSVSFLTGLLLAAVLMVGGVALAVLNHAAATGRVGPNGGIGIRTSATRSSDEAWRAAHQAAKPWIQFAAMGGLASGALVLFLRSEPELFYGVLFVGVALIAGPGLVGAVVGHRAAVAIADRSGAG